MFWSPHDILSHNCLFNFVLSNRGGGKTYGAKKLAIKKHLKEGSQFIYLRRYKTEFADFQNFFADVSEEFPDVTFEVKGKKLFINGNLAGYGIPLSTALMKKSVSYKFVKTIIFDEFIIDSKLVHYLDDEVVKFLEFYETVDRMRDETIVLFLANAISVSNPYFSYFGLRPDPNKRFTKKFPIIVEYYTNEEFIKAKYKTRFGQLIKGTVYGDYAVENKFLKDNANFVEKKTGNSVFQFAVHYNSQNYGFWYDFKEGNIYMSDDVDPSNPIKYVLTTQDHQPNMMLINNVNKSYLLKQAVTAWEKGYMRFKSMELKNKFLEILNMIRYK